MPERFCLALLVLLTAAAPAPAAQSARVDVAAYVSELERLLHAIPATPPEELAALRDRVRTVWTIGHGDQEFVVSTLWIWRALDEGVRDPAAWKGSREVLMSRLKAAREEAVSLRDAGASLDASGARATLGDVLARKEFQRDPSQTAIAHLRRAVTEWFLRLWERVGGTRVPGRALAVVLAWVAALLALGGLATWLVRMLVRSGEASRLALSAPEARRRSARAWALQAAAAGDAREVVRCAYRAALVRLEEEGAWRADETRTPREHLRLLAPTHARRSLFADITRRFEEVWFGARTATSDDRRALLERLKELGCLPAA